MKILWAGLLLLDVGSPPPGFNPQKVSLLRVVEADRGVGGSAAVSPDGRNLATLGPSGLRLWSLPDGKVVRASEGAPADAEIAFSGDGRSLLLLCAEESTLRVLRVSDGAEVAAIPGVDPSACRVASAPDGKTAAVSTRESSRILELPGGRELFTLAGSQAAFSSDGRRIATSGEDGSIRVWDARTGAPLAAGSEKCPVVVGLAFSPDGSRLLSGSASGEVRVWNVASGKQVAALSPPAFDASVAWSRDGRWIASGGNDGVVRLWDAAGAREAKRLDAHDGLVAGLAFTPDGRSLVTWGTDGKVKLWGTSARPKLPAPPAVTVGPPGTGMMGITGGDAPAGGVVITSIIGGSTAERYGLQVNDVITEFKGLAITGYGQLALEVLKYGEGEEAKIKLKRGEKEVELKFRLGRR